MARGLLPLVAITVLLVVAPLSVAFPGAHGSHVTDSGVGNVYELDTTTLGVVIFLDEDGNEVLGTEEPVFLVSSGTEVHPGAVRLAQPTSQRVGSQVQPDDTDRGISGTVLGGDLAYLDNDGDQSFTPGDLLIYDLSGNGQGQVSVKDIYLTGPSAGSTVSAASQVLARPLTALAGTWGFDDVDDNGFDLGDRVYADGDGDGRVSLVDIRITSTTAEQFGTPVPIGTARLTLPLSTGAVPDNIILVDEDEDGRTDPEEPAYLSRSTEEVAPGSVRIASAIVGEVGTIVRGGDNDASLNAAVLAGTLSFDGTGDIGKDEPLIFDHDGPGSGTGDINEMILSGQEAGRLIDSASPHHGASLSAAPGTISFLDVDGDGGFGLYDILYLDADDDGFVSSGDVQLSSWTEEVLYMSDPEAGGSASDGGDGTGDPNDADGDGVPDDEDACPSEPAETSDGCPSDADGDGVPDDEDACPSEPASTSDGCPAGEGTSSDSDGDGVPDDQDACPDFPGEPANDGCPEDADGDGVPDDTDACPDTPARTDDGCPPDSDGDGVLDPDDACPDEPGEQADGCPEPASTDDDNATDGPGEEDTQGSPGPGLIAVLASLAGLAVAAGRRRR